MYNNKRYGSLRRFSNLSTTTAAGALSAQTAGSVNSNLVTLTVYPGNTAMGKVHVDVISEVSTGGVGSGGADFSAGGTGTTKTLRLAPGSVVEVTAAANPGYRFISWTHNMDNVRSQSNPARFTIVKNTEMRANFQLLPETFRTVKVNWNSQMGRVTTSGNSNLNSGGALTVHNGDTITLTATPDEGYSFVRWDGVNLGGNQQSNKSKTITLTVSRNYELTAVFAKNNPDTGDNPPGNGENNDPNKEPDSPTGNNWLEPPVIPAGTSTIDTLIAYAKRYWWAIAIVAYLIYKERGKR